MEVENAKYYVISTLISILLFIGIVVTLETKRQIFLRQELQQRSEIAQLIKNKNGKFQIVDIDSVLVSDDEWDEVVILNTDISIDKEKYNHNPLDYPHGVILRNNGIFLRKDNEWWFSDIFLRHRKVIEDCDSIVFFRPIEEGRYANFWFNNHIGLINGDNGDVVIKANYLSLNEDINHNFKVESENKKVGLIDLKGQELIKPDYDGITQFYGDVYCAIVGNEQNLFINGTRTYSCEDCSISTSGSHYAVTLDNGYKLLNSNLSYQSSLLDSYDYLSDGYFSFEQNGAMGVLQLDNSSGSIVIPAEFKEIVMESNGYWKTKSFSGLEGLYHLDDEIVPAKFSVVDLSGNYVFVSSGGRWGLWDAKLSREWIAPRYYSMEIISDDLIKVEDGGGMGLLKKSGEFYSLIECAYSDIVNRGSHYEVSKNGRIGVVDYNGNEVLEPLFDDIQRNSDDDLGVYFVAERNNWRYLLDEQGSTIIPEDYNFIEMQGGDLAMIKNYYGLYGWYNLENRQIQIKCKFDEVDKGFQYKQDIVRVREGDEVYNIDYYGTRREGSATRNKIGNIIDDGVEAVENFFK